MTQELTPQEKTVLNAMLPPLTQAILNRTAHTVGAWKVVEPQPKEHWGTSQIVSGRNPEIIAQACPVGRTVERNANAYLILAAPDLARELQKLYHVAVQHNSLFAKELGSFWAADVAKALTKAFPDDGEAF